MLRDLSAKLAADRAAAARDQNGLVLQIARDLGQIDLYAVSSEQIKDIHIADLLNADLAVRKLGNSRENLQIAACFLANIQNLLAFLR